MDEKGLVLKVTGRDAIVAIRRGDACAKCGACAVGKAENEMILTVKNECDANIGDVVFVEMENAFALRAVLIMYGVPLAFLVGGIFMGYGAAIVAGLALYREIIAFGVGVVGLFTAYTLIHSNEKHADRQCYMPVAKKILRSDAMSST